MRTIPSFPRRLALALLTAAALPVAALAGGIGGTYYAGTSSISANVPQGASTMATPDGRNAGAPLAEGCSPSHGADTHGPTAVFKSVSKLDTGRITGGVLLNQKVTPQVWVGKVGEKAMQTQVT